MKIEPIIKPPASEILKSAKVILSPNEEIGEHKTEKREELIIIIKGSGLLYKKNEKIRINAGDTQYIEEGIVHNIINNSENDLEYIYVVALIK